MHLTEQRERLLTLLDEFLVSPTLCLLNTQPHSWSCFPGFLASRQYHVFTIAAITLIRLGSKIQVSVSPEDTIRLPGGTHAESYP